MKLSYRFEVRVSYFEQAECILSPRFSSVNDPAIISDGYLIEYLDGSRYIAVWDENCFWIYPVYEIKDNDIIHFAHQYTVDNYAALQLWIAEVL